MINKFKRLNKLQIISFALLTITLIVLFYTIDKGIKDLFWLFLGLNMLGFLLFSIKWSSEQRTWSKKMDKNYSQNFTRKSSETIFWMSGAYYLLICIVIVADYFIKDFRFELDTIIALYIISIVCNYLGLIVVDKTMKHVIEYTENIGKGRIEKKKK